MKFKLKYLLLFLIGLLAAGIIYMKLRYPMPYREIVTQNAQQYQLEPAMVYAVIHAESKFRTDAASPKEALGLMQLTIATGEWIAGKLNIKDYSLEDLYDPELNIMFGCWYLSYNLDYFNNDIELALAAYNAGRGNVAKWLADEKYSKDGKTLDYIPFKETRNYIERVKMNYKIYSLLEALYGW